MQIGPGVDPINDCRRAACALYWTLRYHCKLHRDCARYIACMVLKGRHHLAWRNTSDTIIGSWVPSGSKRVSDLEYVLCLPQIGERYYNCLTDQWDEIVDGQWKSGKGYPILKLQCSSCWGLTFCWCSCCYDWTHNTLLEPGTYWCRHTDKKEFPNLVCNWCTGSVLK